VRIDFPVVGAVHELVGQDNDWKVSQYLPLLFSALQTLVYIRLTEPLNFQKRRVHIVTER
jgi:hypothetical protein